MVINRDSWSLMMGKTLNWRREKPSWKEISHLHRMVVNFHQGHNVISWCRAYQSFTKELRKEIDHMGQQSTANNHISPRGLQNFLTRLDVDSNYRLVETIKPQLDHKI